jgi:hypothetical protein
MRHHRQNQSGQQSCATMHVSPSALHQPMRISLTLMMRMLVGAADTVAATASASVSR